MLSIRKIGGLGRAYRNINRYRQILRVLFKYGFDNFIESIKLDQYLEFALQIVSKKRPEQLEKKSTAERLRMVLEELGPTFVKLGQTLSVRPDLIPLEYVKELTKLQDDVPPISYEDVCLIIKQETGFDPLQLFATFEETSLAAASLGQVHKASLKSGELVAVKVQRPSIKNTIEVDLEIMLHLATLMERHLEELHIHRPTKIVEEFSRVLEKEINYNIEARHVERFGRMFLVEESIYVPKVFREYSSERMLTLEYIDGIKASQAIKQPDKYDLSEIAKRGANSMMKQIFIDGFFHADPHPGNFFIMNNSVVCYLDFGMMGYITRQERIDIISLVMHLVKGNEHRAVKTVLKLTTNVVEPDVEVLERDLAEIVDQYLYLPLHELEIGKLLGHITDILTRHGLCLKPNLFLVLKALTTIEGVGLMLDPDFEIIKHTEPYVRKIASDRLAPKRVAGQFFDYGTEIFEIIRDLPGEIRTIVKQAKDGRIKIEFVHRGLSEMIASHEVISNRISFAIVLAALIIASALIVLSGVPPAVYGIPVIGLIGFLVSGVMGFWLLLSIIRHGRI